MHIKKLEKYKKGNFKLKEKHIYAQTKIKKIINHILNKNLIGGSNDITNIRRRITDTVTTTLVDKSSLTMADIEKYNAAIFKEYKTISRDLTDMERESLTQLIDADKALIGEFNKYQNLQSENYDNFDKPEEMRYTLLKMQKSLFDLQIKILFKKANKINQKVNITPLLKVITDKIEAMNKHIESEEISIIPNDTDEYRVAVTQRQAKNTLDTYILELENIRSKIQNMIKIISPNKTNEYNSYNLANKINEINEIKSTLMTGGFKYNETLIKFISMCESAIININTKIDSINKTKSKGTIQDSKYHKDIADIKDRYNELKSEFEKLPIVAATDIQSVYRENLIRKKQEKEQALAKKITPLLASSTLEASSTPSLELLAAQTARQQEAREQDAQAQAAREREENTAREREVQIAKEQAAQIAREQAAQAIERQALKERERAAREQEENTARERQERELKAAREREVQIAKEQAAQIAREQAAQAIERLALEERKRAAREQEENTARERQERELKAAREREEQAAREREVVIEREAQSTDLIPPILSNIINTIVSDKTNIPEIKKFFNSHLHLLNTNEQLTDITTIIVNNNNNNNTIPQDKFQIFNSLYDRYNSDINYKTIINKIFEEYTKQIIDIQVDYMSKRISSGTEYMISTFTDNYNTVISTNTQSITIKDILQKCIIQIVKHIINDEQDTILDLDKFIKLVNSTEKQISVGDLILYLNTTVDIVS